MVLNAYDWLLTYLGPILAVLAALVLLSIGLTIWLGFRQRRVEARYRMLTAGTRGGSLDVVLEQHVQRVNAATTRVEEIDLLARRLEREGRQHFQRVGFVRFNPFRDAGGDQSFSLALADHDGNGIVLSSLHGREGSRVYGKPLAGWHSPYPLTDEEQAAISQARDGYGP